MKPLATTLCGRALWIALLAVALGALPAAAQHTTVSIAGTGGLPQGDFGDRLDRAGFGVNAAALYGVGPVSVGLEAGMLTYDRSARALPPILTGSSASLAEVRSASRIGHLHAVVRLQLPEGPVQPYVDGIFGVQRFSSHTDLNRTVLLVSDGVLFGPDAGVVEYEQRVSTLESEDFALSYGVGGGLLLRVASGYDDGRPFEAFLDLGARYVFGDRATYQLAGTDPQTGEPVVGRARSTTDMLRPQIGLVVRFGR